MRRAIRLGVLVAVTLASSAAWTGARADEDPSATSQASSQDATTISPGAVYELFEPGAASAEPAQAIEESPGTKDEQAWVQSIWSSP
jgi:hypothetical protein